MTELPRSQLGKVMRKRVREQVMEVADSATTKIRQFTNRKND